MHWLGRIFGKSPKTHEARGDAYVGKKAWGLAKREYETALEKMNNDHLIPSYRKKRLLEKTRAAKEALAIEHLQNAKIHIEKHCFDEALELLELALTLTRVEKVAHEIHQLIRSTREAGKCELYEQTDEIDSSDLEEHRTDQADDDIYFKMLIESLPEPMQKAYLNYGDTFRRGYMALNRGEFDIAAEDLSKAMKENPPEGFIPMELASALVNLNRNDEAKPLLEEFVKYHPDFYPAYELLCEIYFEKAAYDQAEALLSDLAPELAESIKILSLRGETMYRAGKLSKAEAFFMDILDRYGWDKIIAFQLAKVYESMDELYIARQTYEEIMAKCSGCGTTVPVEIKRRYADLRFAEGDRMPTLLELYYSLVQDDPDNAEAYYENISQIYYSWGDQEAARKFSVMADK